MKISEIVYKKKPLIDFGYLNGNKCFNLRIGRKGWILKKWEEEVVLKEMGGWSGS
jgi:hypothetical protein